MHLYVEELFASLQGEGPKLGIPQYFLRFSGCNLDCSYCDTEARLYKRPEFKFEEIPGSGIFTLEQNPIPLEHLIGYIKKLQKNFQAQSLALTGGEPLLFTPALRQLKIAFPNLEFYLESNGILADALLQVQDCIDYVSMDIKFEKYLSEKNVWPKHAAYLEVLKQFFDDRYYIKMVFDLNSDSDLKQAWDYMERLQQLEIDFQKVVWQPIYTEPQQIHLNQLKLPKGVRLIPQMHKFLKLL